MAGEIQMAHSASGQSLYAHIWNATGLIFRISTVAFEAYVTANIGDYNVPLIEQGAASRLYLGTMPVVAVGYYQLTVQHRAGGSPAESDDYVGSGDYFWNGTALYSPGSLTIAERNAIAAALLDLANGIETGITMRQALRQIGAMGGLLSGAGTGTETIRGLDDATARAVYTIDGSGNRTAVARTLG